MLIIEFSYNFLYVWNCMKLYDKKFFINGNCMIRSFGQPGFCLKIGGGGTIHKKAKLCILCIVSGFRNKDDPFVLLLFFPSL